MVLDSSSGDDSTLRLLMQQWQGGGNRPTYYLGAQLLAWPAPPSGAAFEEVPIDLDIEGLDVEQGIFAREVVLKQARAARHILEERRPERVVVFGGECSVDLAPFAYLNERYDGDLALLWLDAHPDAAWPMGDDRNVNFHSMVLTALLGIGDPAFVAEVTQPVDPTRVMYIGLRAALDELDNLQAQFGHSLPNIPVAQVEQDSSMVLSWLRDSGVSRVAVHFDLDVLDPVHFGSTFFHEPNGLRPETTVRLLTDVAREFDVVGLGITEYAPRDAVLLADMLKHLPVVGGE